MLWFDLSRNPTSDEKRKGSLYLLSFEILPGVSVSDNALAAELGMSRAPVREAIMRLEAIGLIERCASGVICAPLGNEDILEICCLRMTLETLAVELVFDRGGLGQSQKNEFTHVFDQLTQTSSQQEQNYEQGYYWDDVFHSTIIRFSGNTRLVRILQQMQLQIARVRWLNILSPRHQTTYEEHAELYRSLMADDREASISAMQVHLKHTKENFMKILESPQYKLVHAGTFLLTADERGMEVRS